MKSMGWASVDGKPSDEDRSISFGTVHRLSGNTVTSPLGGPAVSPPSQSCAPHRWLTSRSPFPPGTLTEGLYKLHLPHLTQCWLRPQLQVWTCVASDGYVPASASVLSVVTLGSDRSLGGRGPVHWRFCPQKGFKEFS